MALCETYGARFLCCAGAKSASFFDRFFSKSNFCFFLDRGSTAVLPLPLLLVGGGFGVGGQFFSFSFSFFDGRSVQDLAISSPHQQLAGRTIASSWT